MKDRDLQGYQEIWYTDGLRKNNLTGTAWTNTRNNQNFLSLGKYSTVFQAEVQGINSCAKELIRMDTRNKRIAICTDS